MNIYFAIVSFMFGTVFGSFFNVVGLRTPKGILFDSERSYCPSCSHQLRAFELIPILSYVIQQGECLHFRDRISFLYPFIEVLTGLLFASAWLYFGLTLELITALLFISMVMIIWVTDISYMIIPDKILLFFLPFSSS